MSCGNSEFNIFLFAIPTITTWLDIKTFRGDLFCLKTKSQCMAPNGVEIVVDQRNF